MDKDVIMVLGVIGLIIIAIASPFLRRYVKHIKFFGGEVTFRDEISDAISQLKKAGINADFKENLYSSSDDENALNNVLNRDAIIDRHSSLIQIIKSLADTRNISFSEITEIMTIIDKLLAGRVINVELAGGIRSLCTFGEDIRNEPKAKIDLMTTRKYLAYVDALILVIRELIKPIPRLISNPQTSTDIARQTQVGMPSFPNPERGRPVATLSCQSGILQGQRFPIEKPIYRLGANSQNDLVINNDKFVSGRHAYISYEQGSLLLFDDNSSNGTFLNNRKLDKAPMALKLGDEIRLGNCTFKLI